ncbi:hypothetical protein ACQVA2_13780 [Citrobacter sp. OP27]
MTIRTDLQQSRQNQAGIANLSAAQGQNIAPGQGNTVPNVMQTQDLLEQMMAAKNKYPVVNPPSEEEIQKTMWTSSFVVGLLGAIVSGNAAGGIACGMSAALAIHDHGFDLRQRGDYIHDLHDKGFSAPAILKWYETGDNSELDKESAAMEKKREFDVGRQDQRDQFKAMEEDKLLDRNQRATEFNAGQSLRLAQFGEQKSHNTVMENIAQLNAQSNRIEAVAKMGAQAGANAAQPGADSGVSLQNASFNPQSVQMPSDADNWSPQEKAAYIAAAGQAYHGQMLKDVVQQVSNAKNLRMGLSTPNQLFGKVEDYYKKGITAPHTQAGDFQANQSVLGIESPTAAPRANQVEATEQHMPSGPYGSAVDWLSRKSGYGQSDAGRESTNKVLTNSFIQQASGLANEAKNAVQSGGYDLNNPAILAAVVSGLGGHIGGEDLKKLMSGEITPEQWAQKESDKYSAPKDFGAAPTAKSQGKQTQGDY